MSKELWFSTVGMTCLVVLEEDIITSASAPIVKRFVGQRFDNLYRWASRRFGPVKVRELTRRA